MDPQLESLMCMAGASYALDRSREPMITLAQYAGLVARGDIIKPEDAEGARIYEQLARVAAAAREFVEAVAWSDPKGGPS